MVQQPPQPGTVEIPSGKVRRFHYTGSDDILSIIAKEGLRVDRSESWKFGDPRAIWSNPSLNNKYQPTVEFYEDPKKIISDQYQFSDVSPDQIVAIHYSWYPILYDILNYIKENSKQDAIDRLLEIRSEYKYDKVYDWIMKNIP